MKHNKEKEDREKIAQKFFSQNKRSLYDIMPRGKDSNAQTRFEAAPALPDDKPRKLDLEEDTDEDSDTFEPTINAKFTNRLKRRSNKFKMIFSASLVLVLLLSYYLFFVMPKATIEITLKQKQWEFHETFSASLTNENLPLQVLSETKNAQLSFPATGSKNVSRKAHGTIKVCNAFNSDAQSLVATTRFQNASSKIFRLDKGIVVPGATIADGKIQAKCIDALVTADVAGAEYNVSPESKWTIPGFKGSPKFDGFYGISEKTMSGGLIGNTKVPTAGDIAKAEQSARESIRNAIEAAFVTKAPQGIVIVQDSKGTSSASFVILKKIVLEETDASGNFQYFIEAKDERVALREADVVAMAVAKAQGELGADFKLADSRLDLKLVSKTRDTKGVIDSASISADFIGGFVKQLTEDEVKKQAAGKTKEELTDFIPTHQNFNAHITLWPFWVSRVPNNQKKITVLIDIEKVKYDGSGTVIPSSSSTVPAQ